jgi:hypothetical protein
MPPQDDELLARADGLVTTANRILIDLDVLARLEPVGIPVLVGSAASRVMVVPDIDFSVLCPVLEASSIIGLGQSLFDHPRINRVRFADERGPFRSTTWLDDGIYCGLRYHEGGTLSGTAWKFDIWFFQADAPRHEIAFRDRLLAASAEERLAILRIKHELVDTGRYGTDFHGIDVYRAVLDRGVRSVAEFNRLP